MPALQRTRLERLGRFGMWLGVEASKPSSRSFSESASASSGRYARHGDADRQHPCQMEWTRQTESSAVPMPKAAPVGARMDSALDANTGKEICRSGGQDAHDGEAEGGGDSSNR